jgi:hypothetical protein
MSIPPEVQREYLLEGYDFSGLGQIKTETLNLPIRAILEKRGATRHKLSTILTPGPGTDDLERNTHSARGQRRGVDSLPASNCFFV